MPITMGPVTVLVCGDRNWTDSELIEEVLRTVVNLVRIIEGEARGADKLSATVAKNLGVEVERCPADWRRYGRRAGPIRNRIMLDRDPTFVFAFHDDLENSKGTKDCVEGAIKRGIPVLHTSHQGSVWMDKEGWNS